jgi:hypothetical protein
MAEPPDDTTKDLEYAEPAAIPTSIEEESPGTGGRTYRWIVWVVAIAMFVGYVVLTQVHTRLGVEAPRWDKDGREYVWRSWWRARHEIVDFGPSGLIVFIYAGLAIAFVGLSALACWIALVAEEPPAPSFEREVPNHS